MTIYTCQFCARKSSNAGANKKHENSCKNNPNPIFYARSPLAGAQKGNIAWNKGLTKEIDIRVAHKEETRLKCCGAGNAFYGRNHTEETKQKLSQQRIKYLTDNPTQIPYRLYHYSKGQSSAEIHWKEILSKLSINYVEQHRVHRYKLDFALVDQKVNIEIDGDQHYLDDRIVRSDQRRDRYLMEIGWKIIRIRWSEYEKMSAGAKQIFVSQVYEQLIGPRS